MSKKQKKGQDQGTIIENPDVIVDKAEEFLADTKKRNITVIVGGVLILAIVGLFLYRGYLDSQNKEAQEEMFPAIYAFEADSLNTALNGDGLNYGFLKIIADYPGTRAANMANLYAGNIYLQLGDFNSAIRHLDDYSSDDYVMQARAYALTGDAYMELEKYKEAADYYEKAADYKANESYTPVYLQKLAIAQENAGNNKEAAAAWGTIVDEYVKSRLVQEAKKHKARLEGMSQ
jgi:predicted negative regulator of RcsB-dependent stress response